MTKHHLFLALCVLPLVILLVAACLLWGVGHPAAAWSVGTFGTPSWLLIFLAYIVLVDSKDRWPEASGWDRLRRVLTFTR